MDWQRIRSEYINTDLSYREIAAKYGLSEGAVRQHGARGKWVEARAEQQRRAQELADEKAAQKKAGTLSEIADLRGDLRISIYREIARRMENPEAMESADFRRLVQSYLDMNAADQARGESDSNELLESLYELMVRRRDEADYPEEK